MANLEYKFTNDILFKMVFVSEQGLLKRLVAAMLCIQPEAVESLVVKNPEVYAENIKEKYCRLDINMKVGGQLIDLEMQVKNEGDFPERSLFYWAQMYTTSIDSGGEYSELLQTIVINILGFKLFDCLEFKSEFKLLETSRHTILTDRMAMYFYELPKLPDVKDAKDELKMWLSLFKATTVEDFNRIEAMGVPYMTQALDAYRQVTATEKFKEIERQRIRARLTEASAMRQARAEGEARGEARGRAEGEARGRAEIARNLLSAGIELDIIAKTTGLSHEEIKTLF